VEKDKILNNLDNKNLLITEDGDTDELGADNRNYRIANRMNTDAGMDD